MLLTIMPPMSGSRAKPLCVAETPCTTCMYSGMNITTPRNAMLMTNDAHRGDAKRANAEQAQRQDRIGRARLDP